MSKITIELFTPYAKLVDIIEEKIGYWAAQFDIRQAKGYPFAGEAGQNDIGWMSENLRTWRRRI